MIQVVFYLFFTFCSVQARILPDFSIEMLKEGKLPLYQTRLYDNVRKPVHGVHLTEMMRSVAVLDADFNLDEIVGPESQKKAHIMFQTERPMCPTSEETIAQDEEDYFCIQKVMSHQLVNPCPGSTSVLGCKNSLCKALGNQPFMPNCYFLPNEWDEFAQQLGDHDIYFLKPQAHGRVEIHEGLELKRMYIAHLARIADGHANDPPEPVYMGQARAENPYLFEGRKVEVRVLALTTSLFPLRIFASSNLLVKTASAVYDPSFLHAHNICMHVLNQARTLAERSGCPYTGEPYMDWATFSKAIPVNDSIQIWEGLKHAVVTSHLQTADQAVKYNTPCMDPDGRCFNLWGFDFMLTADHGSSLLEVNALPFMSRNTHHEKWGLLKEAFSILGLHGYNRTSYAHMVGPLIAEVCLEARFTEFCEEHSTFIGTSIVALEDESSMARGGTTERLFPRPNGEYELSELPNLSDYVHRKMLEFTESYLILQRKLYPDY